MARDTLQTVFLARHGETEWSLAGRHTGRTDLPLTQHGEQQALGLGERLRGKSVAKVFTSPLQRAARTCALAGYGDIAVPEDALLEWDYGRFEGMTAQEIQRQAPGWKLFRDGCPGGEAPGDVATRADRMIELVRAVDGPVLLFSSAHILRVLATRWLGLPPDGGRLLVLKTASLSQLGYDHDESEPVIRTWNS